jgi:transposase
MVNDSANILKRFYFLQRELVLMQAGWLPGTQHWQSKLLLPEFLWQDSLTCQELRQRVLELRYPLRAIDLPPDEALVRLWRSFADAPNAFAFAEGLGRVLKPLLRQAYRHYLERADDLDDGPTLRILTHALADLDEQIDRWGDAAAERRESYPEAQPQVDRWLEGLRQWQTAVGDLLAPESRIGAFDPAAYGGRPFVIARRGQRDRRFALALFSWPDQLDPARGPGEEMQLQVRQAVAHINEVWAAEMAAACLYDLAPSADPEFLIDAARWCYDEIRHCRMGFTRLREWGFAMEEMPMGSFSYDAGADVDALTRLGIIFYFESAYIHTKSQRARIFGELGDRVSSHDMDFDWADEQIHAHYGARWLSYFLDKASDPRKPMEFREQAEGCIRRIRAAATDADRIRADELFERTMQRARELAIS